MRLIDADALHEKMCELMNRFRALGQDRVAQDYNFVATIAGNAPTVDAVPVVRCRECIYAYRVDGPTEEYDCRNISFAVTWLPPEHFCSYGQRRDQSADVRNMGQFAGDGKTDGGNQDGQ